MDNIEFTTVRLRDSKDLFFIIRNWIISQDYEIREALTKSGITYEFEDRSFVIPSELLTQIILSRK